MAAIATAEAAKPLSRVTVSTHSVDGYPPVATSEVLAVTDPVARPKSATVTPVTGAENVAVNVMTLPLTVPSVAASVEEYATVGRSINTSSAAATAKVKAMAAAAVIGRRRDEDR